mgnify:CR=1 FL=1
MELQPLHLKNELVELIPLQPEHFDELFAVASDPLIWEQHPNPDRYKKEVFENFFKGAIESKGAFLIKNIQTGKAIGSSRLYDYVPEKSEIKIGYTFFSRDCWGKPFNKEVKRLMIEYALSEVDNIIFHVGANNIRSQRAMEKIGALKIGEETVAYFGEAARSNFVYAISKANF